MTPKTWWLFTAVVFTVLLLPALVQQGMFLDGVSYACIARNLATGLGDFSHPHYTATLYPVCYEQPPLVFWLQSLFFRLLGDQFWVERLYSLCMALLAAMGILLNARLVQGASHEKGAQWLPILLWIVAPITFWSFSNNMLECTMSVLVLFSTYFATKSVLNNHLGFLVIAATLTAAAVLSKGPVGFFPVVAPVFAAFFLKRTGFLGGLGKSFFMLLGTLLLLEFLLFSIPGMQDYLDYYLHQQLLPTLSGQREKQVENPFSFLLDLLSQLALPCILLLFYLVKTRFKGVKVSKSAFYFIALGLAGSLPLMLTPKQSTHYLLPSIPYFALGLASILGQAIIWPQALDAAKGRLLEKMAGGLLLLVVLVSCFFWGKFRRDEVLIQDITAICAKVGKGTTLGTPPQFSDQWLLHAYFGRLGNVSLDARNQHDYWLMEKGGTAPDGFQPVMLDTKQWSLWRR